MRACTIFLGYIRRRRSASVRDTAPPSRRSCRGWRLILLVCLREHRNFYRRKRVASTSDKGSTIRVPIAEICAPRIILDILYVVEKHFDARRSGKSLFLSAARELSGVRAEAVNGRKFGRWGLRVAAVGLTVSSTTTSGGSTGLFTSEWCLLLAGTDDLDGGTGVLSESFSGS